MTQQFTDWVNAKPRDEAYQYFDLDHCAFAQFLDAHGIAHQGGIGGTYWTDAAGTDHDIAEPIASALEDEPCTFGALADRLAR